MALHAGNHTFPALGAIPASATGKLRSLASANIRRSLQYRRATVGQRRFERHIRPFVLPAKAAHMTTGHQEQPSLSEHLGDTGRYLAAVADTLTAYGIQARLSSDGCIPTLLAADSRSGRAGADVTMDSDAWIQAAWAPAPGTDPATAADTILAVLNAISPGMSNRNRALGAVAEGVPAASAGDPHAARHCPRRAAAPANRRPPRRTRGPRRALRQSGNTFRPPTGISAGRRRSGAGNHTFPPRGVTCRSLLCQCVSLASPRWPSPGPRT